ncbi:MAG TPA: glycosyltransferase family 4 protein [Polyangiaceae bacterium]|jgi:glycosyltransferase involved in cell wall biosynthesis|nr:MAG: Glycosyl transferases group 1 [Deltaproteobacteria bacterium ADurb.Bin207]HNS96409.1 glycosyltransferase family 4 protein [Polyangiaceae bacterium]HNZ22878.1 glycosyltransferase family 4 protein [Polyangiaceae bacterium]HOD21291.1 glycosyltransferase family 4 protein [Polyangiaceae bacterium]HOE48450.1 glycosyltransferase family 4 protein [Polyangiaceae bacterium]
MFSTVPLADAGSRSRILFVSKAVAPPFRDGATCLVRDLSQHFQYVTPSVLTVPQAPPLGPRVRAIPFYRKPSRYAPAAIDNVRVLLHLLRDFEHDIWHFVFAPNPRTSQAARLLRKIRRLAVVQTVASRPLRFEATPSLLFGDHVIALSTHTADRLIRHGAPAHRISVIPPAVADLTRSENARRKARQQAGIEAEAPLLLYAGDLEFSHGVRRMAEAIPLILREAPETVIAFACRTKTPKAQEQRQRLERHLEPFAGRVRFLGEVDDLPALIASASALPFPVDDLYGKVDHPYVVLEAALLETPVIVPKDGPMGEIGDIATMAEGDRQALAKFCVEMVRDGEARRQRGAGLRKAVLRQHDPSEIAGRVEAVYKNILK